MSGPDILTRIIRHKKNELAQAVKKLSLENLISLAHKAGKPRGFVNVVRSRLNAARPAVIAEIKKASPSKGVIRRDFNPEQIALQYERAGAACLSVLTDKKFFQGSSEHLRAARQAVKIPVLRKDFIIDPYQVYEARAMDADCILLIAAVLDDNNINLLAATARELEMDVLIEVHDENELYRVLDFGFELIGINNRDLRTFTTRLDTTLDMVDKIPQSAIVVTESGITGVDEVKLMLDNGVFAFLIGEAFMRAPAPGAELKRLFTV